MAENALLELHRPAPMDGLIRALTGFLLALPPLLFLVGVTGLAGPARAVLEPVALGLAGLYLAVWLFLRPTAFECRVHGLRLVWPMRSRSIPWHDVARVEILDAPALRARLGSSLRIGAGGLWGGFGLLWTSTEGLVDMYVTRQDGLALITLRGSRPLLVSPEFPEGFRRALLGRLGTQA